MGTKAIHEQDSSIREMIYVFEDHYALDLEPLTLTRATFELHCGALTHLERIRRVVGNQPLTLVVRPELAAVVQESYPDLSVNPEQVEAGRHYASSFEVAYMSGVGHFVMMEDPETFNRLLEETIQKFIDQKS